MKAQRVIFRVVIVLCAAVFIANIIGYICDTFFFSINDLPKGDEIGEFISAGGTYTVHMYKVSNSFGDAIRGELKNNENGKTKNVYWQTKSDEMTVFWLNDKLCSINGNVIDITNDVYDCRRPLIDENFARQKAEEQ